MKSELITLESVAGELDKSGAHFTQLGLELPVDTTKEEWARLGERLIRCQEVMSWWVADWAAHGEKRWGALKEFAELHGWSHGTIRNYATVARSVDLSRRHDNLTFSFHAEVSALPAPEQSKWLDVAEKESLPCSKLRAKIREARGDKSALKSDGAKIDWPQDQPIPEVAKWLQERPEEYWTANVRDYWRTILKPLVDIYERLN